MQYYYGFGNKNLYGYYLHFNIYDFKILFRGVSSPGAQYFGVRTPLVDIYSNCEQYTAPGNNNACDEATSERKRSLKEITQHFYLMPHPHVREYFYKRVSLVSLQLKKKKTTTHQYTLPAF